MTEADLRQAIEDTLASVPFSPPLSVKYTEVVMAELRRRLPGATLDVCHHYVELVVEAREGATSYKLVLRVG